MRSAWVSRTPVASALAAVLGTGCYYYTPVELGTARPEQEVRILLADSGARYWATGVRDGRPSLDGRLIRWSGSEAIVQIPPVERWMLAPAGGEIPTISVPQSSILSMEVKQLSRGRTWLVVGGFGLGMGLFLHSRLSNTGGRGGQNDLPTDDASVVSAPLWWAAVVW